MQIDRLKALYVTPPTGVALVSTMNKEGRRNLAPFAWWTIVSKDPPMVAFSIRESTHTYAYIKETNEFVVGIPTPDKAQAVYNAGKPSDADDEFAETGFTPVPSKNVRPDRIAECQSTLECVFHSEIQAGDHVIITGEIVCVDIRDELVAGENAAMRSNIRPLGHLSGEFFIKMKGDVIHVSDNKF